MFLEILQNSQENACAKVTISINFIKIETLAQMFSCEFWEISKKTFFTEHLWTSASELYWFLNPMSNKLLKVDDKSTKVLPYENTRAIVENVYQSWI